MISREKNGLNMGKNELVSIIIVNWNGKRWLNKCLTSLSKQFYKPIEIIIVDNKSSDGSIEYINKNFPRVKIFKNNKNVGYATAINKGVKQCKGNYIMLLNTDTWVDKNFTLKLVNFYNSHDYSVIGPVEKKYSKNDYHKWITTVDPTASPARLSSKQRYNKFYIGVCVFLSKEEYIRTKGLDSDYFMYYEDLDWFWRLNLLGKKYLVVEDINVYHAGGGSSGSIEKAKLNMFLWRNQNALQTLLKNYSLITLTFILPLYFLQNIFEIIFFMIVGRSDIAKTYIQGWKYNKKRFKKILKKRKWVQKNRKVNDLEVIKKMYLGVGKLQHFLIYIRHDFPE